MSWSPGVVCMHWGTSHQWKTLKSLLHCFTTKVTRLFFPQPVSSLPGSCLLHTHEICFRVALAPLILMATSVPPDTLSAHRSPVVLTFLSSCSPFQTRSHLGPLPEAYVSVAPGGRDSVVWNKMWLPNSGSFSTGLQMGYFSLNEAVAIYWTCFSI